ncbi:MAG: hypothetical protein KDG89_11650 [Geminicoccaceae bacterium]|nr:hypothetical protein [Geminicoccaceae bacterium]
MRNGNGHGGGHGGGHAAAGGGGDPAALALAVADFMDGRASSRRERIDALWRALAAEYAVLALVAGDGPDAAGEALLAGAEDAAQGAIDIVGGVDERIGLGEVEEEEEPEGG